MEKYIRPETEVIEFKSVDVVTTSGGSTGPEFGEEVDGPGFGGQIGGPGAPSVFD